MSKNPILGEIMRKISGAFRYVYKESIWGCFRERKRKRNPKGATPRNITRTGGLAFDYERKNKEKIKNKKNPRSISFLTSHSLCP